jgi:hypothetical protein
LKGKLNKCQYYEVPSLSILKKHLMHFATLSQQNAQFVISDIFVHVSTDEGLSSGNQTKVIQLKTKLVTFIYTSLTRTPCGSKHVGVFSVI